MRTNHLPGSALSRAIGVALGALAWLTPCVAAAQTVVDLVAAPTTIQVTLPNGASVVVPMWGFGLDPGGDCSTVGGVTVPGPRITVPQTASTLTIHLRNCLPAGSEGVSIMIPGQQASGQPEVVGGRVVSMAPVATAGGPAQTYTFSNLKPGTFLYHSGSHPAVQVQMGLYGAMTKNVTDPVPAVADPPEPAMPGVAYTGVEYDHEVVLLYSEIDIALHQAVAAGTYGSAPGPTSTIDYAPSLYLINGKSYANDLLTPPTPAGAAGQRTLLRLLNAGLKSHAPIVNNGAMSIAAEDGNRYPHPRPQAALLLAAGKTHDAIWVPSAQGTYSVYDRLLGLNALGQGSAGMLAKLQVSAAAETPPGPVTAVGDTFGPATEDIAFPSPASVLDNDSPTGTLTALLVTQANAGLVTLNPDGSFTYTPAPNFFGVDSFTYRASDGTNSSEPAMVMITVAGVPDAPVADNQSFGLGAGETLPLILTGSDADGEALTFYLTSLPASGTLSIVDPITSIATPLVATDVYGGTTQKAIPNGSLLYTAGTAADTPSFAFLVVDTTAMASAPATVNITVQGPRRRRAQGAIPSPSQWSDRTACPLRPSSGLSRRTGSTR